MTNNLGTATGVAKSLNQLACVLVGRDMSIATNELIDEPFERIDALVELVNAEFLTAAQSGDSRLLNQSQRKCQSLASLALLAYVIRTGTDWDRV